MFLNAIGKKINLEICNQTIIETNLCKSYSTLSSWGVWYAVEAPTQGLSRSRFESLGLSSRPAFWGNTFWVECTLHSEVGSECWGASREHASCRFPLLCIWCCWSCWSMIFSCRWACPQASTSRDSSKWCRDYFLRLDEGQGVGDIERGHIWIL